MLLSMSSKYFLNLLGKNMILISQVTQRKVCRLCSKVEHICYQIKRVYEYEFLSNVLNDAKKEHSLVQSELSKLWFMGVPDRKRFERTNHNDKHNILYEHERKDNYVV